MEPKKKSSGQSYRPKGDWERREPPLPKPYELVRIGDIGTDFKKDPKLNSEGHDCLYPKKMTGKIFCHLKTLSPLHIGSGIFELRNNTVLKGIIRSAGEIIIPGSSLKGVVRSVAEAISDSCISKTSSEVRRKLPKRELRECDDPKKLCVSCRIFGGLGYQGRVSFSEARMTFGNQETHNLPPLYSPRPSYRGYLSNNRYIGRKFYYHGSLASGNEPWETVSQGSVFEFNVDFENLSLDELSLLSQSLGLFGDLTLKVGGGKPACLGTVVITPLQIEFIQNAIDFFLGFESKVIKKSGEELKQFLLDLKQKHSSLIRDSALKELKDIWAYPVDRNCPERNY